jgi:hypothetical protein
MVLFYTQTGMVKNHMLSLIECCFMHQYARYLKPHVYRHLIGCLSHRDKEVLKKKVTSIFSPFLKCAHYSACLSLSQPAWKKYLFPLPPLPHFSTQSTPSHRSHSHFLIAKNSWNTLFGLSDTWLYWPFLPCDTFLWFLVFLLPLWLLLSLSIPTKLQAPGFTSQTVCTLCTHPECLPSKCWSGSC